MIKKIVALCGVFLFLAGCNSIKLVYQFGDYYVLWQLDQYFDLTPKQEEFVTQRLSNYFEWHRKVELPQYVSILEQLQDRGQDGISLAELDDAFFQFEQKRDTLMEQLIPEAAQFLAMLHPHQIQRLEVVMREENQDLRDQLEEPWPERQKQRQNDFITNLENWFGPLSSNQKQQFHQYYLQWMQSQTDPLAERLQRRKRGQQVFLTFLRSHPAQKEIELWLREWSNQWTHPKDPTKKLALAKRIQRNKERILLIDNMLTQQQRHHAVQELQKYIDQIRELVTVS